MKLSTWFLFGISAPILFSTQAHSADCEAHVKPVESPSELPGLPNRGTPVNLKKLGDPYETFVLEDSHPSLAGYQSIVNIYPNVNLVTARIDNSAQARHLSFTGGLDATGKITFRFQLSKDEFLDVRCQKTSRLK